MGTINYMYAIKELYQKNRKKCKKILVCNKKTGRMHFRKRNENPLPPPSEEQKSILFGFKF